MRALTLIRPMSAAIVHGTKRIENRPQNLPMSMRDVSTVVAVHAGKKWNNDYERTMHDIDGLWEDLYMEDGFHAAHFKAAPYRARALDEGIVGLMRLTGRVYTADDPPVRGAPGDGSTRWMDPWWSGPFGYEIDAVVAFETPIECRGMQGFWPVPFQVVDLMQAQARPEWPLDFKVACIRTNSEAKP